MEQFKSRKVCMLLTYIIFPKFGGHETSLDNAESWLIGIWITEVLLHMVCVYEWQKSSYHSHVKEKVFKQGPHVVTGVDLFHLHFCVNVTMVQEVDVGILHLQWNSLLEKGFFIKQQCPKL